MEIRILKSFRVSYGGRSSMVEPQIVVLVVAGSSPVGHPSFANPKFHHLQNLELCVWVLKLGAWDY